MAKKTKVVKNPLRGRTTTSRPSRSPTPPPKPKPKRKPKPKPQTAEKKRGGQFARHLKVLAAIHKNHEGKPFNKRMLADWLRDEFDRDLDELSAWFTASAAAQKASSTTQPSSLQAIQEASRDRNAERAVKSLQKFGLEIIRTDEAGNAYTKKKKEKPSSGKKSKTKEAAGDASSAKVWWSYDANGQVATDLRKLFTDFKLTGYELEGIIGCNALLENFYGLPMQESARKVFKRITSNVPPSMWREAAEQADVWRYLFRRPRKYELKKKLLRNWNDATILRNQCTLKYAPANVSWLHYLDPDSLPPLEPRRIAAFGTVFIPEEDSLYLVGCEPDQQDPGKWLSPFLYKFDRVFDLVMEEDPNPLIADMPSHPRIEALDGMPSRLDLEKLFTDSVGAFFRYDETHTLVVRVHDPKQISLCLERPFHGGQHVEIGPGSDEITLTVESCFLDEVLPRLLAMKDGFTVVEPQDLALRIREIAGGLVERHK